MRLLIFVLINTLAHVHTYPCTKVSSDMPFRVNAKNFAITFPATTTLPFNKQQLLDHLSALNGVSYTLVSKELHQTGVPHYHALVSFSNKKNIRDARFFDYLGAHANVQACRSLSQWIEYVKKDGDWCEHGTPPINFTPSMEGLTFPDPATCDGEQEWLTRCLANKVPYGYTQRMWALLQQNDCLTLTEDYTTPAGAQVCNALTNFTPADLTFHSLIIVGPSGCGKTTWAKTFAPKPALFVSNPDDLKKLTNAHKSIIFDDCDFNHWPRTSQIHLVDRYEPRSIHLRYSNAMLAPGILRIFTANTVPVNTSDEAIRRRTRVYRVTGLGQALQGDEQ